MAGIKTYSISKFYQKDDRASVENITEALSHFKCKFDNEDLERFLKEKAIEFEERNLTRTYLVCDTPDRLEGYFSIGLKSIALDHVSKKFKRVIASDDRVNNAHVFLIAHIGASAGSKLEKYQLLRSAVQYIRKAQVLVGGRAIYLDCDKENERLIKYYETFGFTVIDEDEHYKNMIIKI